MPTPEGPEDLKPRSWVATLKRTVKAFQDDQLTDWAAALTYYGILSIFPALLALVAVLGLVGQSATQPLIDNLSTVAPGPASEIVTDALRNPRRGRAPPASCWWSHSASRSGPHPATWPRSCAPPTPSTASRRAARS
jgi:Virulence factor BrkB